MKLAVWVGCNWKLYFDNPGRSQDGAVDTTMPVFATCPSRCARTTGYIILFADPQGVALLQEVTNLTFVPDLWLIS